MLADEDSVVLRSVVRRNVQLVLLHIWPTPTCCRVFLLRVNMIHPHTVSVGHLHLEASRGARNLQYISL